MWVPTQVVPCARRRRKWVAPRVVLPMRTTPPHRMIDTAVTGEDRTANRPGGTSHERL